MAEGLLAPMESLAASGLSRSAWRPLPQDLAIALFALEFAGFSFAFPDSGPVTAIGLPRGFVVGALFIAVAALALLVPFAKRDAPAPLAFVRTFYPQLLLILFFEESILLSVGVSHGLVHDQEIAAIDKALFGFQPSRRFHEGLARFPAINELMFGGYFLYYVMFAVTPWLAFLQGRREEAEREIFVYVAMMALIFTWYLLYRVEGPKYWFPDLKSQGYAEFSGDLFVPFFRNVFRNTELYGAAFPSTHVAFSLLMTIYAARTRRSLLWIYVPAFALVAAATVYIYAHYFTDILGGIAATTLLAPPLLRAYPAMRDWLRRKP